MAEKFEAIVVGCGPTGAAAALELAKNGVQVLVVDRSRTAGGKNVTGGILYGQKDTPYNLDYVLPHFEKEAPLERPIHAYYLHAISGDKVKTIDITPLHRHNTKFSYAVLRAKFDAWLSEQVHQAARKNGGGYLCGIRACGLLMEAGKIAGILTSELEPIRADIVIAADGATSELVRAAGIRDWMEPQQWFQGVKVVVRMPKTEIEKRFKLSSDQEGSAHLFAGDLFGNARGGGFLYTNYDSLSIGTVFHLDSILTEKKEPHRYLDALLRHPFLQNWLEGAEELEYSAKLIPDGKKHVIKRPYAGRLLAAGDAANHLLAAGPIIKGMNLGITAGILAAKAYVEAKKAQDLDSVGLRYSRLLAESCVHRCLSGVKLKKAALSALTSVNATLMGLSSPLKIFFSFPPVARAVEASLRSYSLSEAAPDHPFVYNQLPAIMAHYHGEPVRQNGHFKVPTMDDRIGRLTYDTDVGNPHITVLDESIQASGNCAIACPVSSTQASQGCYRIEEQHINGSVSQRVILDTQPCVECGTCAIVGKTRWEHPRGGKGVEYKFG